METLKDQILEKRNINFNLIHNHNQKTSRHSLKTKSRMLGVIENRNRNNLNQNDIKLIFPIKKIKITN